MFHCDNNFRVFAGDQVHGATHAFHHFALKPKANATQDKDKNKNEIM